MNLKNVKIVVVIIAIIGLLYCFTLLDYSDLSWSPNKSIYIGIISCVLIGAAQLPALRKS
jgi:hypothetical protein